jgi:hypothetical protein
MSWVISGSNIVKLRNFFCLLMIALLCSCQTKPDVADMPPEVVHPGKILALPFKDLSQGEGENKDVRCPVCGRVFFSGEVATGAADFLSEELVSWMQNQTNHDVFFSDFNYNSLPWTLFTNGGEKAFRKMLAEVGRKKHFDTVLAGFLFRFKERVGKGYSIQSPASVAFSVHLIRVSDAETIWSAHFDETQQSLGENLFQLGSFLRRGGRWITAKEMAVSGLDKLLREFPQS